MGSVEEPCKAPGPIPQSPLARQESLQLPPQYNIAATRANSTSSTGVIQDSGDDPTSGPEALMSRYRHIIRDAIGTGDKNTGPPTPQERPLSESINVAVNTFQPVRSHTVSSSDTDSAEQEPQEPTQKDKATNVSETVNSHPTASIDAHRSDFPLSNHIIDRHVGMPQTDLFAQLGLLEELSGIGTVQIPQHCHHIDMSAFEVDMPDLFGDWTDDADKDASLPGFFMEQGPIEGGGEDLL